MTRIKISFVIKIVAIIFYFLLAFFLAKAQVTSDFSSNADGWNTYNASTTISSAATYNAGGYITDGGTPSGPVILYAEAPIKFRGNRSSSYNQNLTFDLKTDFVGTNNTNGDLIIAGTGGALYYQLPTKPGTTFTSYTIQLNETFAGWHFNGVASAAPTQTQMKAVLSNITSFRIRTKYTTANTSTATGSLDNVVLNILSTVAPPTITSFTPQSAVAGTAVTITGANFNTTASQNNIFFNSVRAIPSSATATQLVVTVPASAAYGQLVVENLGTGLQGFSAQSFSPLFDNNKDFGGQIIPASMAQGNKAILPMSNSGNTYSSMDKGDFDGDGWVDLVTSETFSTTIYVFRNLGVTGTVSPSSFSAGNILAGLSSIPGGSPNLGPLTVADVDNDGKLDIAAVTSNAGITGYLAVFRNTSTAGSISFASPQFFSYPYYSSQLYMTSGDLDGDGRKDFLYTTGTSPGGIWVNQNLSTPGNVDFAYGISVGTNLSHSDITTGDLNADGKPEIIAATGTSIEIYQNTSVIGNVAVNAPFSVPSTFGGAKVVAADLDADSKLDLAWSGYGAQYVYFSKNIYSGSSFDATSFGSTIQIQNTLSNPQNIAVGDMNADGKIDVVMTGYSDLGIMQNVGTGALSANSFLPATLFQGSAGAQAIALISPAIADLDGDNKPEVAAVYSNNAVTAVEKGLYIFRNESFPCPRIDTMTPSSGTVGTSVNFVGDHFSAGLGFPPVFGRLGKIATAIIPSSNTSASGVVTPSVSSQFTFTEHGLTAYSRSFNVLFNTTQIINSSSFGSSVDFALAINPRDALDVADFDDDGKMDVSTIDNGFTAKIFKNTQVTPGQSIAASSLTVQGTTYSAGYNLIALDIDGDGKTDLNSGGGLLQNTSSGSISFTSVTSTTGGFTSSSFADFNKDGKTDLVFTNGSLNVQVFENMSRNGSFTPNGTFQNFGGGAINLVAPSAPYSVAAADFDGDGYDDIISINPNTNNSTYFLNNKIYGRLTASSFSFLGNYGTSGLQPYDVTSNDFDGDGKIDIAITYYNSSFVSVLLNNSVLGDISFTGTDIAVATKGYKITSQDLDGDGKAEIVVIHQPNPGPGSFTVLQNKCTIGAVSFTATNFPITRNPQAIKIADINGDRKPDILIVANSGTIGNDLMAFENKIASPSPPIVTSFTPSAALPNTTVTINGSGFASSTGAAQVFFGAVKGTIISATATQLTVKVPPYALNAPLTVENLTTNLSGISLTNFTPLFDNNKDFGGRIIPSAMDLKKDLSLGTSGPAQSVSLADLDSDGLPDLVVPQLNDSITIFRNKGNGLLTVAGFEKFRLFTGTGIGNHQAVTADIDGDGKLDIVVIVRISNNDAALIFRNLSTPGALSFGSSFTVSLPILTINNSDLAVGDMDGDGRPELLLAASDRLSVFRNTSAPGSFGFSPKVDIVGAGAKGITLGDIDGDGKLDIAMANGYYGTAGFQLTRNTSTVGTLSFSAPVNFAPANGTTFNNVVLSDLDSDGKPDLSWVGFDGSNSTYILRVMKNNAVPGTIDATSFAPNIGYAENPLILSYTINPWSYSQVADINGDGKPDFIGIGNLAQGFSISQNVGQTGVIDTNTFLEGVLFQSAGNYSTGPLAIGDLDGDGKPEVIVPYPNVSIYKNLTYPAPRIDLLKNSSGTTQTGVTGSALFTQGDYQFTNNQSPTIRFGAVTGPVTANTNTQVTTTVPGGASQERVALTLHGLTGFSPFPFAATFATAGVLDVNTFPNKIDYALTTSATGGLTVSDFDNDGKPDVAAGDGGNIKLFQNSLSTAGSAITSGTFSSLSTITTSIGASAITVGDFDGDGLIDLQSASNIYHNSSGTQAQPISFETGVQAIGGSLNLSRAKTNIDFNHDGKTDFVSVNAPAGSFSGITVNENFSRKGPFVAGAGGSYYNFGTFNAVVSFYTSPTIGEPLPQTTAGDFDGDGYDDIVFLVKNSNELRSMLNTKLNRRITSAQFNTYQATATGASPAFMVTADFDLDGKLDIAVAYTSVATISVFKNTSSPGTISFAKQDFTSLANTVNMDAADLDGDGKVEIVTIHGTTAPFNFSILKNTSTAGISFAPKIDYALATQPLGLALSDVNLDAKPDILITRVGPFLSVFQNQLAPGLIITISAQPSDFIACTGDIATFTAAASGTTNITYQWQYSPDGMVAFTNLSNTGGYSNVATATLSVTTAGSFGAGRYRCKIDGDFATTVFTNDEGLFINPIPSAPSVTGGSACTSSAITLNASGGTNGQYRWYTVATGGAALAAEVNASYTTPVLSSSTTYYVAINNGSCESSRTAVTATVTSCNGGQPPVIAAGNSSTVIGASATLNLLPLLSDPDNNLDLTTLKIVSQPTSGAIATIDANLNLIVNYTGLSFSGTDHVTLEVCDLTNLCVQKVIDIEVNGDIFIYNGISPGGANPKLIILYIESLAETKNNSVHIFDRWENLVWHGTNYDNSSVVFTGVSDGGSDLPSGVYFYKINFSSGRKTLTGFISLRRQ